MLKLWLRPSTPDGMGTFPKADHLKYFFPSFCHSGKSRARSEASALSSDFEQLKCFWTPVFTGVTTFYESIIFVCPTIGPHGRGGVVGMAVNKSGEKGGIKAGGCGQNGYLGRGVSG